MLGDSVVLTVLGQVAFMPILVLAARLCPEVRGPMEPLFAFHLSSTAGLSCCTHACLSADAVACHCQHAAERLACCRACQMHGTAAASTPVCGEGRFHGCEHCSCSA